MSPRFQKFFDSSDGREVRAFKEPVERWISDEARTGVVTRVTKRGRYSREIPSPAPRPVWAGWKHWGTLNHNDSNPGETASVSMFNDPDQLRDQLRDLGITVAPGVTINGHGIAVRRTPGGGISIDGGGTYHSAETLQAVLDALPAPSVSVPEGTYYLDGGGFRGPGDRYAQPYLERLSDAVSFVRWRDTVHEVRRVLGTRSWFTPDTPPLTPPPKSPHPPLNRWALMDSNGRWELRPISWPGDQRALTLERLNLRWRYGADPGLPDRARKAGLT